MGKRNLYCFCSQSWAVGWRSGEIVIRTKVKGAHRCEQMR
jgi:hypothetical protein